MNYSAISKQQYFNNRQLMIKSSKKSDNLLIALRKIIRAIDLHSKQLTQKYGVTGPQMLLLKAICQAEPSTPLTSSELAQIASLSQATVTSIVDRLVEKGFVKRERSMADKRKILVLSTSSAKKIMRQDPNLLQEEFIVAFEQLKDWEKSLLTSSFERVADMMQAKRLDAAPILSNQEAIDMQ